MEEDSPNLLEGITVAALEKYNHQQAMAFEQGLAHRCMCDRHVDTEYVNTQSSGQAFAESQRMMQSMFAARAQRALESVDPNIDEIVNALTSAGITSPDEAREGLSFPLSLENATADEIFAELEKRYGEEAQIYHDRLKELGAIEEGQ